MSRLSSRRVYHPLDGLRGVAALFVAVWHIGVSLAPFSVGSAYLAVDLFFLMSGFVIANAYQDRLGRSLTAPRFILLRLVRLYPLYLAGTVIGTVVLVAPLIRHAHAPGVSWTQVAILVVPALLMLPGPDIAAPALLYHLDFPAWSLFWELVGNAWYGALDRLRHGWGLVLTVGAAVGVLIAVALANGSADGGWQWHHWYVGPIRVMCSFFLGVIICRLQATGRLPVVRVPVPAVLAVVCAVLYLAPAVRFRAIYDLAAILVVFPLVVWLCVVNEPHHGRRWCTLAGLISYPLYTIHAPVLLLIELIGHHRYGYDGFDTRFARWAPWSGLLLLAGLLVASWLLATTYDVAVRRRLGRLLGPAAGPVRVADAAPALVSR